MIDLIQVFEFHADAFGYEFTYGRESNTEWQMTDTVTMKDGESVIILGPIIEDAEITNSFPQSWNVTTTISLGKKFDTDNELGTYAELDETDRQKWDRRLFGLRSAIETYIKTVFCAEAGLELTRCRIATFMNKFDENIDGISAEIGFNYDSRVPAQDITDTVFESTWKTNNAGPTEDNQIKLPLEVDGTYDFIVDWGDESEDHITVYNQAETTHTYTSEGTYTVKITGTINGWRFNDSGNKLKILTIESWGELLLGNNNGYFYGCSNLNITATDELDINVMTTFENAFNGCSSLTAIQSGLFVGNSNIISFASCYFGCGTLINISSGLFNDNTAVTDFAHCFGGCSIITSIPSGLFDNNILVTDFDGIFDLCVALTSIPTNLFDYCPLVTTFRYAFGDCYALTSIPSGLFVNNSDVLTFYGCFQLCGLITSIPSGLFDAATNATDFSYTFRSCSDLAAIPSGLFDNNTAVLTFIGCFRNSKITSIPATLFDNCSLVTDFDYCFASCTSLTGNAPELWLREPEPNGAGCFTNDTGLTNYGDIPGDWK